MTRSARIASLLLASGLALGVAPALLAAGNSQIALKSSGAYPSAHGTAQYQSQPGQREVQIEIDHIRSLAGRSVNIYLGGAKIGAARVNSRGVAELTRNSELAQRVPRVGTGTSVAVQTSQGVKIVTGTF